MRFLQFFIRHNLLMFTRSTADNNSFADKFPHSIPVVINCISDIPATTKQIYVSVFLSISATKTTGLIERRLKFEHDLPVKY
jgi:hypothetical protein